LLLPPYLFPRIPPQCPALTTVSTAERWLVAVRHVPAMAGRAPVYPETVRPPVPALGAQGEVHRGLSRPLVGVFPLPASPDLRVLVAGGVHLCNMG